MIVRPRNLICVGVVLVCVIGCTGGDRSGGSNVATTTSTLAGSDPDEFVGTSVLPPAVTAADVSTFCEVVSHLIEGAQESTEADARAWSVHELGLEAMRLAQGSHDLEPAIRVEVQRCSDLLDGLGSEG